MRTYHINVYKGDKITNSFNVKSFSRQLAIAEAVDYIKKNIPLVYEDEHAELFGVSKDGIEITTNIIILRGKKV